MAKAAKNTSSSSTVGSNDVPPELRVSLPSIRDIQAPLKDPNDVNLPVEFLLVTVENFEFIACYVQLKDPFRCWFDGVGYVYFGDQCTSQEKKVKVALIKCYKGSTGPGSSLITVKNVVAKLRPKGVISVGTCSGLNPEKTKLGDVVVSAKLTTYGSKVVTSTGEQSTAMRSYVSRNFLDVIKHAGDGWEVPLKDPGARDVQVHCAGEFLSGPEQVSARWRCDELATSYPLATAIEMEGEGIFTVAFDVQIEWLVVKGIADFADGTECVSENWSPFASVMAASVVANILSDPIVFQGWRHYEDVSEENQSSSSRSKIGSPNPKCVKLKGKQSSSRKRKKGARCSTKQDPKCTKVEGPASAPFDLKRCQTQLRRRYNITSQVQITPWNPDDTVHINEVYTNLSWLRENKTPRGTTEQKLKDYSKVFACHEQSEHPKRILIYGRPGIGKTTFSQKLSFDWSNGKKKILKKFDLLLSINLRDVGNIQDFGDVLNAANLLAADDVISVDSLHKYVRENQERVLLVLDGYDEYSAGERSDIHKIWKGSLLRDCCVLMTTRPTEDDKMRKSSDIQCKIRGFDSKEQVENFASKFLSERDEIANLENYLDEEEIWDIAEIPLLLLMICLIWREKRHKRLPKSRLELYERFVETILYHMVVKESGKCVKGDVLDFYKDELTKMGKVALEALLRGDVYVPRKHLDTQSNSLSETMIRAGLFQISKLSSAAPDECIFFLHKSIQEFLAAWFIMQGRTDCVSIIDSLDKILRLEEILKFMCEWSVDAAREVFHVQRLIGEREGLTSYNFTETPSIKDFSEIQRNFISISLDCLLCCSASDRQAVFSYFLQCVNYCVILNKKQVRIVAREQLLRSPNSWPNYLFFNYWFSKTIDDEIFSIMVDLNTTVVSCSGEIRDVKEYSNFFTGDFFLKKEGQQMYFYVTRIYGLDTLPTELLTELMTAPVFPSQQGSVDELSKSRDDSRALVLTENMTDQIRQHCLSFVRKFEIYIPSSKELMVVSKVLPFVTSPRNVHIVSKVAAYDDEAQLIENVVSNVHFTGNLHRLTLRGIDLTAKCATDIAQSLHQTPNLHELDLSRNPLCSGVRDLPGNLHHVPQLTTLELSGVGIRERECEIFAISLKYVKKLQVLDLSHNPLGHGIVELAKTLNCVSRLTELRLEDTQMGEEEVSILASALKYVPKLVWLALGSNQLGRGIGDLIQNLSSIPNLEHLFLYGIKMTKSEAEELWNIVARGTKITDLKSDYHVIDNDKSRLCTKGELRKGGGYWFDKYVNCGWEDKYKPITFAYEHDHEDEEGDHVDEEGDSEDKEGDSEDEEGDSEEEEDEHGTRRMTTRRIDSEGEEGSTGYTDEEEDDKDDEYDMDSFIQDKDESVTSSEEDEDDSTTSDNENEDESSSSANE